MRPSGPATTAGVIAIGNLQAQIAACRSGPGASVADRATIIDMLLLRGHLLGCIADTEEAAALAEQLVREAPDCAQAYLARTRTRGALHCFAAAFDDCRPQSGCRRRPRRRVTAAAAADDGNLEIKFGHGEKMLSHPRLFNFI